MSTRVNVTINNSGYTLNRFQLWGGPYGAEPPTTITPNQSISFRLDDNDRAGVVYLATDAAGNEMGFVTMSYTCPKLSDNSAEGSPDHSGIFISAGLQTYSGGGTPANFTFNIGHPNLACWNSGSSNNGSIVCPQTSMETWTRVLVSVNNPLNTSFSLFKTWQNGPWAKAPTALTPKSKRIFLLNDNDRAGMVYLGQDGNSDTGFITMSFTCPKLTDNSAEGSPAQEGIFLSAGLQTYNGSGTPALFSYEIGQPNAACWSSGNSNDGDIVCPQTSLEEWARVIIGVNNPTSDNLDYIDKWQNGPWAKEPESVSSNSNKIFLLNDNDRAGIYYSLNNIPVHLSFTCPKLSDNSAEGSSIAGLQPYAENGTPVILRFIIGGANQACWSSGNSNNGEVECDQTKLGPIPDWMKKTLPVIGSKLLKDISIPGTHDSGMSISVDGTPGAFSCNTQTQTQNILNQLNYGARYFDIRPIIGSGTYHTGHYGYTGSALGTQGARGQSIADIITEINTFTAANNELIILNLSHDMDTDNRTDGRYPSFTETQWHNLFDQMKGINNLYCVPSYPDLTSLSLNTFIQSQSCVLIIVDTPSATIDPYQNMGFFPASSLNPYNDYSDKNDVAVMASDQISKMKTQRDSGNYFLFSWTLTQDGVQASTCAIGTASSILDLAEEANNKLSQDLIPELTSTVYPNIIYIDDFSTGEAASLSMYINEFVL